MIAALGTLLADFLGTQFYERKYEKVGSLDKSSLTESLLEVDGMESGIVPVVGVAEEMAAGKVQNGETIFGEDAGGGMHIVGIRAHAAAHSHSHSRGKSACVQAGQHHHHDEEENDGGLGDQSRHVLVSQVGELLCLCEYFSKICLEIHMGILILMKLLLVARYWSSGLCLTLCSLGCHWVYHRAPVQSGRSLLLFHFISSLKVLPSVDAFHRFSALHLNAYLIFVLHDSVCCEILEYKFTRCVC